MAQLKVIKNCQIVLENGILWDGALIIEGDKILNYGKERDITFPENAEIIDADGNYVGPGFIDIHVHGGNGYKTFINVKEAGEFFLSHGETTILATPSTMLNFEQIMQAITNVREGMKTVKNVKGMYMEGPCISAKYGAGKEGRPWQDGIPYEIYTQIIDYAQDTIKVWTVAPERPDVKGLLEYARKVNPEVRIAVGHSEATPMQIRALGKNKPTILTHALCATGRIPVMSGTRGYGPDEYAFKDNDVYCELISDSYGKHVHPEMQQLVLHSKGVEKVILVTDSTTSQSPNPEELKHIMSDNYVEEVTTKLANELYEVLNNMDTQTFKVAEETKVQAKTIGIKKTVKHYNTGIYRVLDESLNVRTGPGLAYDIVEEITDKGSYTVIEVKDGWGKLASGKGWISLKGGYTEYAYSLEEAPVVISLSFAD